LPFDYSWTVGDVKKIIAAGADVNARGEDGETPLIAVGRGPTKENLEMIQAIIEAGAAGRPVVVSDAGGLPEVVVNGITGLVVPRENPQAAAMAQLVLDQDLRIKMGEAGKQHVVKTYDWGACVETMVGVYKKVVAG